MSSRVITSARTSDVTVAEVQSLEFQEEPEHVIHVDEQTMA